MTRSELIKIASEAGTEAMRSNSAKFQSGLQEAISKSNGKSCEAQLGNIVGYCMNAVVGITCIATAATIEKLGIVTIDEE